MARHPFELCARRPKCLVIVVATSATSASQKGSRVYPASLTDCRRSRAAALEASGPFAERKRRRPLRRRHQALANGAAVELAAIRRSTAHEATPQCRARAPFRAQRFYMPRGHFHVPRARLEVTARHLLLAFRTVHPTAPHFNLQMRTVVLAPSSLSRVHAALKNAPRRMKALFSHFRSPSAGQHGSSPSHAAAERR